MRVRLCWQALLLLGAISADLPGQCPSLIWADEFSGTAVDGSKWQFQLGNGCSFGICSWGNNELQAYRSANATVSDGTLKITARREQADGRSYTSARMRTLDRGEWTFGRFEARIKLPAAQGAWPAFWMLSADETYGPWPESGEIDIMESRGHGSRVAYGTLHFGDPVPNNRMVGKHVDAGEDLSSDFHEFAIDWEPAEIRWFLDGAVYATQSPDNLRDHFWPFDQPFYLLLNLAVGGTFPGPPDPADYPVTMEVDYVRVYEGSPPYVDGEFSPPIFARNVQYQVKNTVEASNFRWSLPEGAVLTAGQGTSAVTIDWKQNGGVLTVEFDSACGGQRLELPVFLRPPDVPEATIENFEEVRALEPIFTSGTLDPEASNPAPSAANPSSRVARYRRNPGEKFDVILFQTNAFPDVSSYVQGRRRLYLDILTGAPAGTELILQFEADNRTSASNFPVGRHSTYTAVTMRRNEWERLEFEFSGRLDGDTPDDAVDNLALLFDPGWNSGNTYYFDNLTTTVVDELAPSAPAGLRLLQVTAKSAQIAWAPAADNLGIADYLIRLNGREAGATQQTSFTIAGLNPATTYRVTVHARDIAGNVSAPSLPLEISTPAANLILDGGFESGGDGAWTGAVITGERSHDGLFSARVDDEMSLLVTDLRPETPYVLSAWLAAEPGSSIRLGAVGAGMPEFSDSTVSPEFQPATVRFRTGTTETTVRILVQVRATRSQREWNLRNTTRGYADDFELIEVRPEE